MELIYFQYGKILFSVKPWWIDKEKFQIYIYSPRIPTTDSLCVTNIMCSFRYVRVSVYVFFSRPLPNYQVCARLCACVCIGCQTNWFNLAEISRSWHSNCVQQMALQSSLQTHFSQLSFLSAEIAHEDRKFCSTKSRWLLRTRWIGMSVSAAWNKWNSLISSFSVYYFR